MCSYLNSPSRRHISKFQVNRLNSCRVKAFCAEVVGILLIEKFVFKKSWNFRQKTLFICDAIWELRNHSQSRKSRFQDIDKKGVRWDLEGPISSGYLAHCSHVFFMSIRIGFSASYSMLSWSFVTPTSLAKLFINPEFCQCPLRRLCQLQIFWYLQQTACFCCISL